MQYFVKKRSFQALYLFRFYIFMVVYQYIILTVNRQNFLENTTHLIVFDVQLKTSEDIFPRLFWLNC